MCRGSSPYDAVPSSCGGEWRGRGEVLVCTGERRRRVMVTIVASVLDMLHGVLRDLEEGVLRDLEEGVLRDGPLGRLHQLRH